MSWLNSIIWRFIYPITANFAYKLIDLLPKSSKAFIWKKARINEQPIQLVKKKPRFSLLFVCPSLGEYESIKDLAHQIKRRRSDTYIEISFFSLSGYLPLIALEEHTADHISLLPADTYSKVQGFFGSRKVDQVIISTLAIWPIFLNHLIHQSIPYSFVAVNTKRGFTKSLYYRLMIKFLQKADHIFVINPNSKDLLSSFIAPSSVVVIGDPRLQSILNSMTANSIADRLLAFKGDGPIIVFGSTHQRDEEILTPLIPDLLQKKWKVIIAPHEADRSSVIASQFPDALLWSSAITHVQSNILIIDEIGILKHSYSYASLAYIGGGFDDSLHNILEPLVSNCLVAVGPRIGQSLDAINLKAIKAIHIVHSAKDIVLAIENLSDKSLVTAMRKKISTYLDAKPNATALILDLLDL